MVILIKGFIMNKQKNNNLKERIVEEMTVDYTSVLDKNFDTVKQFIRINKEGKVDILIKDSLGGKEQILLYLIGKLYAKEAGFVVSDSVGNKELMEELGVIKGSLLPWLKELRDKKKIKLIKKGKMSYHSIPINNLEKTLKSIEKIVNKKI
jgi:hypothetical protein